MNLISFHPFHPSVSLMNSLIERSDHSCFRVGDGMTTHTLTSLKSSSTLIKMQISLCDRNFSQKRTSLAYLHRRDGLRNFGIQFTRTILNFNLSGLVIISSASPTHSEKNNEIVSRMMFCGKYKSIVNVLCFFLQFSLFYFVCD